MSKRVARVTPSEYSLSVFPTSFSTHNQEAIKHLNVKPLLQEKGYNIALATPKGT